LESVVVVGTPGAVKIAFIKRLLEPRGVEAHLIL